MSKMKSLSWLAAAVMTCVYPAAASAQDVKIAFIDPLSGPFAPVGNNQLKSLQFAVDLANKEKWGGSQTLHVEGFDNKGSPQESIAQLNSAIDRGFRYVVQGDGSGAAAALIDAINKHNQRNPDKRVLLLNHGALDPDFTNSKCSFWHFRFDANSDMKLEALTSYLALDKAVKRVYIIGQNYSHGQQVSRAAKEYLKAKRPDVEIVGDDLHPIAQVKDFAPYVAKIKAAGADTVITGNWGADLALLIKAAKEAGLNANFYTLYGDNSGVPTAIASDGENRVKTISYWNMNNETYNGKNLVEEFRKKYDDDYYQMSTYTIVAMLAKAAKESNSSDALKIANTLEGMKFTSLNGEVMMRASDHQIQQPLYIKTWVKAGAPDVLFDQEKTGLGWRTDKKIDAAAITQPTTCQMKRPTS
jgi:branched-chain amino acid transport system substrate-binding protein